MTPTVRTFKRGALLGLQQIVFVTRGLPRMCMHARPLIRMMIIYSPMSITLLDVGGAWGGHVV